MWYIYVGIGIIGLILLIFIIRMINKRRYSNSGGIIERARFRTREGCGKLINKIKKIISGC